MAKSTEKVVLYGCGGHSRSVADILLTVSPWVELVFVDDNARIGERIFGFAVHREYVLGQEGFFLATGDNAKRKTKLEELGVTNLITIIAPTAHRGRDSRIGEGCFVGNFTHIGPEAIVGKNTIINTSSVIEHEVSVGDHCHIGPNTTLAGRCRVGDSVFVGVGSTVRDGISICSEVTIGAGSTVIKNIVEPGTYVGTPARRIK